MTTRPHNPVAAPTATTAVTATPAATTVPPSAPAAGTPPAGTPGVDHSHPAILAAANRFHGAFLLLLADFRPYLRPMAPGDTHRHGQVNSKRLAATPLLVSLLRDEPHLSPRQDPDAIDAAMAAGVAMRMVSDDLHALLTEVDDTSRQESADGWSGASAVYSAARHEAKTQPAMAAKLTRVRAILASGPRQDTTAVTAAVADNTAAKAAARADKAHSKAASASRSKTRTAQAHADAHPAAVSPVPLANPQGPAASADVAPQGPAPGR